MNPMMKCGHRAQGVDSNNNPVCVICFGIDKGATEIADEPDLSDRRARCFYYGKKFNQPGHPYGSECSECNERYRETGSSICRCERDSGGNLAFFEHKPDEQYDEFYCGCHSWN